LELVQHLDPDVLDLERQNVAFRSELANFLGIVKAADNAFVSNAKRRRSLRGVQADNADAHAPRLEGHHPAQLATADNSDCKAGERRKFHGGIMGKTSASGKVFRLQCTK